MPEYTTELETKISEWARKRESKRRFAHTERVVETVTTLAEQWAPEAIMQCRLAAWIHDGAKHYEREKMLLEAQKFGIYVRRYEFENPMLLHGVVAYHKANKKFNLNDNQIRTACAYHTTGAPNMNLIDKLVFLADMLEPERDFPTVETLRAMVTIDIDKTMLLAVDNTLRFLLTRRKPIDPRVIDLYNALVRNRADS